MNKIKSISSTKSSKRILNLNTYLIGVQKDTQIFDSIPVYTDGSCVNNGKPNAISSIGVYFPTRKDLSFGEIVDYPTIHTNQKAEILAISRAIEVAMNLNSPIRIYTDSHYAYSGFTKWIHNWILKERTENIKNFDLFYKTISILKTSKFPFYISHVMGHTGLEGNEEADKLARNAIRLYRSDPVLK